MGWFDEQIRQRKQSDEDAFSDAFVHIVGAVMGRKYSAALRDDRQKAKNAIDQILKYYHIKSRDVPENIKDMEEQLEFLMRPHGIMRRTVELEKGWYRDAVGAMLAIRKEDAQVIALIPQGFSGYVFLDDVSGKWVKVSKKNEMIFEKEAIAFYKPFPLKKMSIMSLLKYASGCLAPSDLIIFGGATLVVTLLGMFLPKINSLIFSEIIDSGSMQLLLSIAVFLACVNISTIMFRSINNLFMERINTKISFSVEAATMMRILSLPANFFKKYSSGELAGRVLQISCLCNTLISVVLSTGLTAVFSLIYITQIFQYAPALVVPSLVIILATALFSIISALLQMRYSKQVLELSSKESGITYAMLSGIQKIKLAGAEKRAFARWANLYAQEARLTYDPPMFLKCSSVISTAISLIGTLFIYYEAVKNEMTVADFYAFNTAYAMTSGAFMALAEIARSMAQIKPIMDVVKPILEAEPEVSEGKQVITRLTGNIELNNVSFRYNDSMPLVIDDLSLKIRAGQYVAIVGETGCGKSTLMRLLLGFEAPQKGAIYYDGKDLGGIDLKSLRRRIGVVMQNGKLFSGDIFSNIVITAPQLTLDEAWEAAEIAGIAEDIRHMPMGMHTRISEGSGGISGGQKQRLMIARAVAPKPNILMFDEATSALDNLTQKKVSESLDKLKCTRIVIAHRLSTIRHCDRILYLEKGKILEDGSYEELIEKKGKFAELVKKQRLDV